MLSPEHSMECPENMDTLVIVGDVLERRSDGTSLNSHLFGNWRIDRKNLAHLILFQRRKFNRFGLGNVERSIFELTPPLIINDGDRVGILGNDGFGTKICTFV